MCASDRKVEGEGKGEAHGDGPSKPFTVTVPLRRWEDWERSRLRKIRREEKRRREYERLHPSGFQPGEEYLGTRGSQYDGSDTISVASSDDDHWGAQIGGYNENGAQYPPPPVGLTMKHGNVSGETVAGADLEAMLEMGFEASSTPSSPARFNTLHPDASRSGFQLTDGPVSSGNGYTPLARSTSPTSPNMPVGAVSSSTSEWKTHVKKRSGSRTGPKDYGPLGPLDPGTRI